MAAVGVPNLMRRPMLFERVLCGAHLQRSTGQCWPIRDPGDICWQSTSAPCSGLTRTVFRYLQHPHFPWLAPYGGNPWATSALWGSNCRESATEMSAICWCWGFSIVRFGKTHIQRTLTRRRWPNHQINASKTLCIDGVSTLSGTEFRFVANQKSVLVFDAPTGNRLVSGKVSNGLGEPSKKMKLTVIGLKIGDRLMFRFSFGEYHCRRGKVERRP